MIYFDGVHLVADTVSELHNFAQQLGLKRCWFQTARKHPHYDVLGQGYKNEIDRLAKLGKVKVLSNKFSAKKIILTISKNSRKR